MRTRRILALALALFMTLPLMCDAVADPSIDGANAGTAVQAELVEDEVINGSDDLIPGQMEEDADSPLEEGDEDPQEVIGEDLALFFEDTPVSDENQEIPSGSDGQGDSEDPANNPPAVGEPSAADDPSGAGDTPSAGDISAADDALNAAGAPVVGDGPIVEEDPAAGETPAAEEFPVVDEGTDVENAPGQEGGGAEDTVPDESDVPEGQRTDADAADARKADADDAKADPAEEPAAEESAPVLLGGSASVASNSAANQAGLQDPDDADPEEAASQVVLRNDGDAPSIAFTIDVFAAGDDPAILEGGAETPTIRSGSTLQLYATANPADAAAQAFVWSSSDESVATVSGTGMVTARQTQTKKEVVIYASAYSGDPDAQVDGEISITVLPEPGELSVRLDDAILADKDCVNLHPGDAPVTLAWSVEPASADRGATVEVSRVPDNAIAAAELTEDKKGIVITPNGIGNTELELTMTQPSGVDNGKEIRIILLNITVDQPIVAPAPDTEGVRTYIELGLKKSVNILDAANLRGVVKGKVKYKSKKKKIAKVSKGGVVTGKKTGVTTITVTQTKPKKVWKITVAVKPNAVGGMSLNSPDGNVIYLDEDRTQLALTATITPDAASQQVKWSSSNPGVAMVKASGQTATVYGLSSGTATITAASRDGSGRSVSMTVVVGYKPATLNISGNHQIAIGASAALQVSAKRPNGQPAAVPPLEWRSSDTGVATVDASGRVTGVGTGSATISAMARDLDNVRADFEVSVVKGVETITLAPESGSSVINWKEGERELTINANVSPVDAPFQDLAWTTDNAGVATVDGNGKQALVTAHCPGRATITATAQDGSNKTGTILITVQSSPAGLTVRYGANDNADTVYVARKKSMKLTPVFTGGATDTGVVWSTSNKKVATVNASGVVKGAKAGTARITVTSTAYGISRTVTVKVLKSATKSISIKANATSLGDGGGTTIKATVKPSKASKALQWFSSNPAIATVTGNGKTGYVQAKPGMYGTVTIYAMALDGTWKKSKAVTIYVGSPARSIAISGARSLHPGEELELSAVTDPAGKPFAWSSSDPGIAAVDASGIVTAKGYGQVVITAAATDGSGKKASVTIDVVEEAEAVSIVGLHTVTVGATTALKTVIQPAGAAASTVFWESRDTSVATVDASGVVTGVATGSAKIIATVDGASAEFLVRVTAAGTDIAIYQNNTPVSDRLVLTTQRAQPEVQLNARMVPEMTNASVAWTSSDSNVATVNANGVVTPLKPGETVVTAAAKDGESGTASVTIVVTDESVRISSIEPPAGFGMTADNMVIAASGTTIRLTARTNVASPAIDWSVENGEDAVTVDKYGSVTIPDTFKANVTIVATCRDNPEESKGIVLCVVDPVTTFSVNAEAGSARIAINKCETLTLTASATPETIAPILWTSSDDGIAEVSAEGVVTPKGVGEATITATVQDGTGVNATQAIEVYMEPADSVTITGASDGEAVYAGQSLQLGANVTFDDYVDSAAEVAWAITEGEDYAQIDGTGMLTIADSTVVQPGNTITVTATSADESASTVITLTVSDFIWSAKDNGKLSIDGYIGAGGEVIVPETINGVTVDEIGDDAFAGNAALTSIAFPHTVRRISARAFLNCSALSCMEGYSSN